MISLILAAGKGTRMKSDQSKVLHKVNGVPMIRRVVSALENIGNEKNIFILGHKKEDVLAEIGNVVYVTQEEQLQRIKSRNTVKMCSSLAEIRLF